MADIIKKTRLLTLQSEKLQALNDRIKQFQYKLDELNKKKDTLVNDAQNHSAEWIERQRQKIDKDLEKVQKAMNDFKKEQEEKIKNWINEQLNKVAKAAEEAEKAANEAKNKAADAVNNEQP